MRNLLPESESHDNRNDALPASLPKELVHDIVQGTTTLTTGDGTRTPKLVVHPLQCPPSEEQKVTRRAPAGTPHQVPVHGCVDVGAAL
jgi:hypothetical protein